MKYIVCAGGTGGHIYPALAIINKIKNKEKDAEILYIGTTDRMESKLIPSLNIPYVGIEMKGLDRHSLLNNINTIKCYRNGYKKAKKVIKDFNPDIVLGIGGYITLPVIKAANKLGYKTFIHEQNNTPGLSNKILKKYATIIGVSTPGSLKYFPKNKTYLTGNPRSEEAYNSESAKKSDYNLSKGKKTVLIVMGSLGSTTISNKLKDMISSFEGKSYEILLVTGKNYYEFFSKIKTPKNVHIVPYIDKMLEVLKITDLIVSRSGASTLAEIFAIGLPSILVPSPYVTHNHQYKNAKEIEEAGAAMLLEEKDFNSDNLIEMIDKILDNPKIYDKMHKESLKLGVRDSSTKIYELIKKAVEDNDK